MRAPVTVPDDDDAQVRPCGLPNCLDELEPVRVRDPRVPGERADQAEDDRVARDPELAPDLIARAARRALGGPPRRGDGAWGSERQRPAGQIGRPADEARAQATQEALVHGGN